jgi:hypothetical protein
VISAPGFLHGLSSTLSKSTSVIGWPLYSPTASKLMPPCADLAPVALAFAVELAAGVDVGLPCWPGLIFTGVSFCSVEADCSLWEIVSYTLQIEK